jgi:hypothetical protein
MNGPDQVVNLVLDALAARRWDDVIRLTHPEAVRRLSHLAVRHAKKALAPRALFDLDVPGRLQVDETERETLLREWEISTAADLDRLCGEEVLSRALGRLCFTDVRDGLEARRSIGTVTEADGVAHVLVRRTVQVRYSWWGRGAGYPMVATLLLTPDGWLLYPQPRFFEQLAVQSQSTTSLLREPERAQPRDPR